MLAQAKNKDQSRGVATINIMVTIRVPTPCSEAVTATTILESKSSGRHRHVDILEWQWPPPAWLPAVTAAASWPAEAIAVSSIPGQTATAAPYSISRWRLKTFEAFMAMRSTVLFRLVRTQPWALAPF